MNGCAASYWRISPDIRKYAAGDTTARITVMYKYDVLALAGNKRYVKKESKAGISVVALKITNHTDSVLQTARMKFFFGNRQVVPLSAYSSSQMLRQGVLIYLLWALLTFSIYDNSYNSAGRAKENPTIIPIGLPIAAGNMIGAGAANGNLRKEFVLYDISDKTIRPGETIYGIISLKELTHKPIRIEY